MNDLNSEFNNYQGTLMALTYRMLGSFVEAEDIVQEVAIEWLKTNKKEINNPKAWLIKVCANKSIDYLKKAYKKREVYPGNWLPEILPDSMITWEKDLENKETLEVSFLLLLENLDPKERAVFILRNVLEYSSIEVSALLDITDANSRKIFQRANEKIHKLDSNSKVTNPEKSLSLLEEFFKSACNGDRVKVGEILAAGSEFWSDGGGKVSAVKQTLYEPKAISLFFTNIFKTLKNHNFEFTIVNNKAGLVLSRSLANGLWEVETVFSVEVVGGEITHIYAQRNPEKLKFVSKMLESFKSKDK